MMENTSEIKNKIIETLKRNGPSLPIQISREIKTNTLFTSAFLSELVSEKKLKISKMKVGNSPIYFIYGQENLLQKFSNYLKNREKEAFDLLKEKKFVEDSEQEPVIRVALREIKDFAFPFYEKETKKLIWRFITNSEEDFYKERKNQISEKNIEEIKENFEEKKIKKDKKELDIFDENKKKLKQKKISKKRTKKDKNEENKFFEKIKDFLSKEKIEIIDFLGLGKKEIILKIKERGDEKEKILFAYDKKRINELEIIKSSKKAKEFNLPYAIIFPGNLLKKTESMIDAVKNLYEIKKLE